jgi:amidohydrolase
MHACGHDGHVAIGLTVAKILAELENKLSGSYYLLFQPAEEIGQGAAAMIADGVLDFIRPDYAIAVHLWAEEPAGWLGITSGPVMAGSKDLRISVHGVGGHSARPHKAVDPILASAHLITALQSIVSRKVDPLESAVYSITQIHAGSTINVIPDSVTMSGTPRYFTPEVEQEIENSTYRICDGISQAFGCEIEVELGVNAPPLVNNSTVCQAAQKAAQKINPDFAIENNFRMMASEDMALFLQKIPGAMFFVGAGKEDLEKRFPLHHPGFVIDESSLIVAASLLLETCQQLAKTV